jgi:hypothetical protein
MFQSDAHRPLIAAAVVALLGACTNSSNPPAEQAPAAAGEASVASTAAAPLTLPISLNAIMVGAIDHASDPLFSVGNALYGTGKLPKTDNDWLEVKYHAYQMIMLGKVIQLPGTGPRDVEWTSSPEWKGYSEVLSSVGMDMLKLAEAKDSAGFDVLGGKLVDACESCHRAFKPEIPTMKIMHKPDTTENLPPAAK